MSLFDFPRINFKGTIQLNPGTANNDDYAQQPGAAVIPDTFPKPYAGQIFGLIDSKNVKARTFGMSDDAFIAWVQKPQTFDISKQSGTMQQIPAEWNYYGDMTSKSLSIKVVGVQSAAGKDSDTLVGATVTYEGNIADVNSEGSPPATQFFIQKLALLNGTTPLLSGRASKGACQWLNFYRNVNLTQDAGAGGYVYHVMKKTDHNPMIKLPGFPDDIAGVICRYYLYNFRTGDTDPAVLYQTQQTNPATLDIVGTFAPLYKNEAITTGPVGRLLVANETTIPTPPNPEPPPPYNNNSVINNQKGLIALAPAVLQQKGNTVSVDFSGTFPEYSQPNSNLKYDFGAVTLVVSGAGGSATIGPVDYTDTDAGDRRGWIFDFDISNNQEAQQILKNPDDAKFSLTHETLGTLLAETDYYFASNQQGIYAEQGGPCDSFLNQGTNEPATVAVYHRGRELSAAECPPISVWQYASVPIQSPGNVESIATNFKPGQHLEIDTSQPGNFLITFSIGAPAGYPPASYLTFYMPPYITNAPSISLRILPNEDYSTYYQPGVEPPTGNDSLTWEVVYKQVLQTYYLLYPAMNIHGFPLNDEQQVRANALGIIDATDPKYWMLKKYMPRTRDMSASRRTLLQAWCRMKPPTA